MIPNTLEKIIQSCLGKGTFRSLKISLTIEMWNYDQRHGRMLKKMSMEDKIGFLILMSSLALILIMKRLFKCTSIKEE